MAIQKMRGLEASKPVLLAGQVYFSTDTEKLFIGKGDGTDTIIRKADLYYLKTEMDTLLAGKTTETYVNQQIANLIAASPATLDTLNELALALGSDPNFATTITNLIATKEPANANIQTHISSVANPHSTTKAQVGLTNADNTSDISKPVSTAQQTALDLKVNTNDARLTDTRTPTNATVNYLKFTGDMKQWLINHGFGTADQQIIPHIALPNNFAIANTAGIYSWFYKQQRFNWDLTNLFASSVIHPAFTVNATEKEIYVGKYQACGLDANGNVDNTSGIYAGSRPNVQQKSSINFDAALAICAANNGGAITGFHLMTNPEWAALQIKAIAGATQPYGNTNYGRDDRDPSIVGRCYTLNQFGVASDQARWLTGSGGIKTSHNGQADGVFDLAGNVWEWTGGLRLNNGEINILADNNAADTTKDQTLNSVQWKAILRDGTLVAPGTAGTLKFDASGNITIAATSGSGSHVFETQTLVTPVVSTDAGVILLKKLGIIPYTTGLNSDWFWYNNAGEFIPIRGGYCYTISSAGVSALYLLDGRTGSSWNVGFRLAFAL